MWWFWLVIGVLLWQAIVTIAFVITGEDADKTALVGGGVVVMLIWCVVRILRKILRLYYGVAYKSFTVHSKLSNGNNSFPIEHIRVRKKNIFKYYAKGENDNHIEPSKWHPTSCVDVNKIRKNGWVTQEWFDTNVKKVQ